MATKNLLPDLLPTKAILSPDDRESIISSKLSVSNTDLRSPETITSVIMSPRIILPAAEDPGVTLVTTTPSSGSLA